MCSHPNQANHSPSENQQPSNNNHCKRCSCRRRGRGRGKKLLKFIGFIALLWITASVSYNHGHKIVGFIKMKKLSKEMDLNWQQKEQLVDLFFQSKEKGYRQRGQVRQIKQAFYQLLDKDNLTQKELDQFIRASITRIQKIALSHSPNILKARNTLSSYQRRVLMVRLQKMDIKRQKKRWKHRSHRCQSSSHSQVPTSYDGTFQRQAFGSAYNTQTIPQAIIPKAAGKTKKETKQTIIPKQQAPATPQPTSRPMY